ncbi:MAG: hypothetical protein OXE59_11345 [Bacteroidetes bacterium]|nr:hypothetical protein [Bacteroidota bacterium]MCY4234318.1 hypothetical protein [Bacteroidota bacterium]
MTIKDIKSAVLKKGWAGKTLSRSETAHRLNALIEEHVKLKHYYANLQLHLQSVELQEELLTILKTLRLDIGKLKEVVFSCGQTAFNGTSLKPESFHLDSGTPIIELREFEREFDALLHGEQPIQHQIRSEAVLTRLREHCAERLSFLQKCIRVETVYS